MECLASPSWSLVHIITAVRAALSATTPPELSHHHDPLELYIHPSQALATINAVGLAFAVWRDRRELRFVEAVVAGRREGKQRRAHARRWRIRKTVPRAEANPPAAPAHPPGWRLLGNQVVRPSSGGASMRDEQVDEGPAAPNGGEAAALAPVTEAALTAYQSRVRSAALALADDDELQAWASAQISGEVMDSTNPLSSPSPLSSPLPSPLPSPPDRDVRDGTDCSMVSTTEAAEAPATSSVWLSEVVLAEESGAFDEERDLMMGIVRAGNGTILSHMGPETGWSGSNKWKRLKLGKDQLVLTKRWHKGHNRWHKRLWLSCQTSHTALAGLVYRGAGGLSRAQTVQVLANSLALEIVVLCMQYSVSSEVLEINLVTTVMASLFAALVCIPSMTIFAAAFNPQIVVNLLKVVATCPGKAWRSRKAILYGLCCCPCKAWGQAVQLVNARATRTTVRARWRKARRRLKLFAGMAAPAPHQMERDCDVESTSAPAAPAKNTSIIKVRPAPSKHTPVNLLPSIFSPASSPSPPHPAPGPPGAIW